MIHIVICLCTDRAIERKESTTPELFQICERLQPVCGVPRARLYGCLPPRLHPEASRGKSAKQSTGKPAGQADSSPRSKSCMRAILAGRERARRAGCFNSTQRVNLPMSEQCRLTERLFQSCLYANEGVKVQESRGESNLPSLRCRLRHQRSHRAV